MKNYKEVHVHRQMHVSSKPKIPHSNNTEILLASVKHELRPLFDAGIKKILYTNKGFLSSKRELFELIFLEHKMTLKLTANSQTDTFVMHYKADHVIKNNNPTDDETLLFFLKKVVHCIDMLDKNQASAFEER
ncbi:hypothetical protein DID76_02250 [Candidatus Marinamargulisbacteria bacterium SCGC AG-414-C22]|nr:hypothetical protein DID76_02250 [Candidatus Marinamargulisbacteria bacterium SCGC AG-414-C22]